MIKQIPFYPFLIVRKDEPLKKSSKGIALNPQAGEKEINYGEIIRLPKGIDDNKVGKQLKVGMKIQWKEYSGAPIYGEPKLFVIDIEEILYGIENG